MKKYKFISLGMVIILGLLSTVDAINIRTIINSNAHRIHKKIEGDLSVFDIIGFVNSYLRFAIGFVCFLFMVWNGFKLIMSGGNEKDMKSAKNALIGCGIGLVSCFLAYIIVNIAINLFR